MKSLFSTLLSSEPFTFLKGAIVFFIGPLSLQLVYLLVIISIDLFFGIQVAKKEQQFDWKTLFFKVRKKLVFYSMLITLFHAFDMIAGLPDTARWGLILMLAGMEILSAAKNTAKLGHNNISAGLEQLYLSLIKPQAQALPSKKSEDKATVSEQPAEGGSAPNGTEENKPT